MEGEICALDPCASPGRQRDSEGQMGSGRCSLSFKPMGGIEETGSGADASQEINTSSPLFFYDSHPHGWSPAGTYIRASENTLGDDDDLDTVLMVKTNAKRCFNCGCLDHQASACPWPRDRCLISLSSQYYNFFKEDETSSFERIHVASEWERQRLEWVDTFEPGKIKNELLQIALGEEDLHLRRIALWGYPRGWYSSEDPRKKVKERIVYGRQHGTNNEFETFLVFGDETEPISGFNSWYSLSQNEEHVIGCPNIDSRSYSSKSDAPPTRWAKYPPDYFDSDTLLLYTPASRPMRDQETCPAAHAQRGHVSTFTPQRQRLWEMIISGIMPLEDCRSVPRTPPWRLSHAFSDGITTSLPCAPFSAEPPPPVPAPFFRPVQPLLASVSPYGLIFSDPTADFSPADVRQRTEPAEPPIVSALSDESDMDISDIE